MALTIKKPSRSPCALRILKRYFNPVEMKTLLTSNYFSSLYYNSEIWLTTIIKPELKQSLISASANALRSCVPLQNRFISFEAIHKQCNQFTPSQIAYFKLSILLFKLFNGQYHNKNWIDLATPIIITRWQTKFKTYKSNNYKIGMNILINRFYCLNNLICLNDLDLSLPLFKRKMKTVLCNITW